RDWSSDVCSSDLSVGSSTSPLTKSATSAKASALCFWSRYSRASIAPEKRNRAAQRAAPAIISLLFALSLMFHPSLCLSRLFFLGRLAALPLRGRFQPPQLGFYGRFFAACFFRKASRAALHLGKGFAAGRKQPSQPGKRALVGLQFLGLQGLFSSQGAPSVFHVAARLVQLIPDHIQFPGALLHRLACVGKTALHAGEDGGDTQRLHRMAQGGAPLFLKRPQHTPGSRDKVCPGRGKHGLSLADFSFRRPHKLGAPGADSLVVELFHLQAHGLHFVHHLRQLFFHAVDIAHQGLYFFLLFGKAVLLQYGEKFNNLRVFPQGKSRFCHGSFLHSNVLSRRFRLLFRRRQLPAVFRVTDFHALHKVRRKLAAKQILRGVGVAVIRVGITVPEVESKAAHPDGAAGLPASVHTLRVNAVL